MISKEIFDAISKEVYQAQKKFNSFHSYHEGYAVIKEEVDELWDEIKADQRYKLMKKECIQIAAMAIRFILDLDEDSTGERND